MGNRIADSAIHEALSILEAIGPVHWEYQDGFESVLFCVNVPPGTSAIDVEHRYSPNICSTFSRLFPDPSREFVWQVNFYGDSGSLLGVCVDGRFAS